MHRVLGTTLITAAIILVGSGTARSATHKHVGGMAEGEYVLPPISFTRFCLVYPSECAGAAARVHMTAERMQTLEKVNQDVNRAIAPRDGAPFHDWRLNVSQGDCNNYAVQKRHELIARGWPAGALALSVVKTGWGEGHLVVSVRTDAGDFVLDNLRSRVIDWHRTGYQWIMRQSARNPQYWVALNGGRPAPEPAPLGANDAIASADESNEAVPAETPAAPLVKPAHSPAAEATTTSVETVGLERGISLGIAQFPADPDVAQTSLTFRADGSLFLAALSATPALDRLDRQHGRFDLSRRRRSRQTSRITR